MSTHESNSIIIFIYVIPFFSEKCMPPLFLHAQHHPEDT